ncbi:AGE family epimerase/isomerase [Spartinivicinus poritis]|uniref:AGE family epimerase/isomerase n=1 Tax=Spartinivicinus poritis TaxID=2994640 RepID=A0ABT5UBV3_9GAMM|nr:AGE family epimerase/isomerase [Spartinivicinus sp. A2-2]MDE1463865.1 AGE family epimerase/isomerase [Spartinivicinus sp. A2-2]
MNKTDMTKKNIPDFRSPDFLLTHIRSILGFYDSRCMDKRRGGFYHHYKDNGDIYDQDTRHLVSSARFVFNYAKATRFIDRQQYLPYLKHAIAFLEQAHWQSDTSGYAWLLGADNQVLDGTNHCYGLAFVLLAYAEALQAGVGSAEKVAAVFDLMEQHFWDAHDQLYKDEASADWQAISPYRGQNANMHSCEALIAAYQATGEQRYLSRAQCLAKKVTQQLAKQGEGFIWEHYNTDWQIDWDYNRDNPRHLFRPWGFQPGHQTEWAKLLLILNRYQPANRLVNTAEQLFNESLAIAWDKSLGGIYYGFDPDHRICDSDKYFWVQAESFAAAALLAEATNNTDYWGWYQRIWQFSWQHLVDHQYGGWFRILDGKNQKYDDLKSPAGKTDYHTMGACYEVLNVLGQLSG